VFKLIDCSALFRPDVLRVISEETSVGFVEKPLLVNWIRQPCLLIVELRVEFLRQTSSWYLQLMILFWNTK